VTVTKRDKDEIDTRKLNVDSTTVCLLSEVMTLLTFVLVDERQVMKNACSKMVEER